MFVPKTTSRPPEGLVIPYNEQALFTTLTHIPFLFCLYKSYTELAKKGDPTCLFFIIGGTIACAFEPIIDVTGFCFFPREGNFIVYEWFNRPIPLLVPGTYTWFVGGLGFWVLSLFRSGQMTRSGLWKLWLRNFTFNLILEYPALYWGMYTYYGHQPFAIGGFPLWFPACHALAPLFSATTIYVLRRELTGLKSLLIVPIVTATYGMANICGFPVWIALSVDIGPQVSYPAGVATFSLIAVAIWTFSTVFPEDLSDLTTKSKRK